MGKRNFKVYLIILVGLWTILVFARIILNISKLYTEEKSWVFLTNEQKREKQFGEKYVFLKFATENMVANSNIVMFTDDGMVYYLARYFLYPTTVIWGERQFTEWGNDINRDYSYAIFYPVKRPILGEKKIINGISYTKLKEFKVKGLTKGIIYKR